MSLPFGIKLKNTISVHNEFHDLLNKVSDLIKKIPSYNELKNDPELLLLVCNLLENFMSSNVNKLDKKDLVVCIMDNVFSLNDDEKISIDKQVQFLFDNNKIKKQKWYKLVGYYAIDWIKRKLG